ncbi:MAG: hypothetical protein MI748_18480 [Opitutales bacterium]|nr:hypothetical protein [Opitutales bacterium]
MESNPFESHEIEDIVGPIPPEPVSNLNGILWFTGVSLFFVVLIYFNRRRIFRILKIAFPKSKVSSLAEWKMAARRYRKNSSKTENLSIDNWWILFIQAFADLHQETEANRTMEEWLVWAKKGGALKHATRDSFVEVLEMISEIKYQAGAESAKEGKVIESMIGCFQSAEISLQKMD